MKKFDDLIVEASHKGLKYIDEALEKGSMDVAVEVLSFITEEYVSVDGRNLLSPDDVWDAINDRYEEIYGAKVEDEYNVDGPQLTFELMRDEMITFRPILWG